MLNKILSQLKKYPKLSWTFLQHLFTSTPFHTKMSSPSAISISHSVRWSPRKMRLSVKPFSWSSKKNLTTATAKTQTFVWKEAFSLRKTKKKGVIMFVILILFYIIFIFIPSITLFSLFFFSLFSFYVSISPIRFVGMRAGKKKVNIKGQLYLTLWTWGRLTHQTVLTHPLMSCMTLWTSSLYPSVFSFMKWG